MRSSGAYAFTQSAGDRWVILATRTIDTKTGRASIDLRRAKGAFRAIRLTVKTGALTLTHVEINYGDGTVLKVRRSLSCGKSKNRHRSDRRTKTPSSTVSFCGLRVRRENWMMQP